MKRTGFKRPDLADSSGKRRFSTLAQGAGLERKGGLRRSRMKQRPPKRLARRAADAPYLASIRKLACISCGSDKPSDAAHMPVGPRGMGLKSPDTNTVPLCRSCHRWFDGHTGDVLPKAQRRALAVRWLKEVKRAA